MANLLLRAAFCAAYNKEIEIGEQPSILDVCENASCLLGNDGDSPLGRLSLKTSAVLVNGMARLLKQEVECLLKDTFKLSQQIVLNNYQKYSNTEDSDNDLDSSEYHADSVATPNSLAKNRMKRKSTTNGSLRSINSQSRSILEEIEVIPSAAKIKRDAAVQASRLFYNAEIARGFDEDLPFGVVLIHDSCRSRVPSKIIISSLNPNVRNLQ